MKRPRFFDRCIYLMDLKFVQDLQLLLEKVYEMSKHG